jgi:hypothetical protein
MRHEDCLAALVHPRGRLLGKFSGDGEGKRRERFFRITAGDSHSCSVVWGTSETAVEHMEGISTAELVGIGDAEHTRMAERADYNRATCFVLVTTVKLLYLSCSTAEECELWQKGIRYLLSR